MLSTLVLRHSGARLSAPQLRAPQLSARRLGTRFSRRTNFGQSAEQRAVHEQPEPEVLWPIAGGAVVIGGILLGSFWLRNDKPVHRMHGWVKHVQKSGMTSDTVTFGWLLRIAVAFGLSQLPVESLRLRQLHQGALPVWCGMVGSYDSEQQQIALAALCALLETESALEAFRQQAGWYEAMMQALPPLVHETSQSMSQPEILYDTLCLSGAMTTHPSKPGRPPFFFLRRRRRRRRSPRHRAARPSVTR